MLGTGASEHSYEWERKRGDEDSRSAYDGEDLGRIRPSDFDLNERSPFCAPLMLAPKEYDANRMPNMQVKFYRVENQAALLRRAPCDGQYVAVVLSESDAAVPGESA